MQKSTTLQKIIIFSLCALMVITQNSCGIFGFFKEVARRSAQNETVKTSQSSKNPKPYKGAKIRDDRPFADFQREILNDFQNENYTALEEKANQARLTKERFPGGYWKLAILYTTLTDVFAEGAVTDEMWLAMIGKLKKWKQQMPQSITARVALGKAYLQYGWFARGSGFSNTVAEKDLDKKRERMELAYTELTEAQTLAAKCPQWYETMLYIAMAESWSEEEYAALLEDAIKYEPDYYYYYYDVGMNALPRWSGRKGDWEKFAGEILKLDSKEKNMMYFLFVSHMVDNYYNEWVDRQSISWDTIKKGYREMETKYGVDKQRLNQYSFLASVNEDMPEAYDAFMKIGEDFDDEVYSQARFNEIKSWATARYKAERGE